MNKNLALLGAAILFAASALAGIIHVPANQPTIQAGINAAFPGDTVLVADATYYENIDFKGKAITVASHFLMNGDTTHINNTIIDGSKPSDPDKGSVVSFVSGEDTTSLLCGFTIAGGSGAATSTGRAGGGIFCYNSGCKVVANKIINNSITGSSAYGGGLSTMPFVSNAWVVLKKNQIAHNTVTANNIQAQGGGLSLFCNAKIDSNLIAYNTCITNTGGYNTTNGGGICGISQGAPLEITMENNTVTHNSIRINGNPGQGPIAYGGGVFIYQYNGRMTRNEISYNEIWDYSNWGAVAMGASVGGNPDSFLIEGNIIRGNAYKHGTGDNYAGGLQMWGTDAISVINNVIVGNSATYGGGVAISPNIKVEIINNTIINNIATDGGGLRINNATVYLMNTIVWGNQASTNPAINILSGTVKAAHCDIQGGWTGTGNINADPMFADTLFHLSDDSPCIGKGIDSHDFDGGVICYCPGTDIAGNPRPDPAGSNPDIGAWESPLKDPISGVLDLALVEIPQSYFLSQNYPNPFNPRTTIEFALPKSAFVTLKVYNLLGEEIATLISEQREAGIHKLNWDASGLASGVYLYRLEAADPSTGSGQGLGQTKKLILMR